MTERIRLRSGLVAATVTCGAGVVIGTTVGAVLAVVAGVLTAVGTLAFLRVGAAHGWLTRQLRARSTQTEVAGTRLRLGTVGGSVFVAGLSRPTIFCDRRLLDELDDDEISAVTLHERAHQRSRDPLRSAAVAVIAPLLLRFGRGRAWLEHRAAAREIAADRYAIAQGADRRAIASALLKVPTVGAAHAAAFAPAVELRLRALLGDEPARPRRGSWVAIAIGVVVGAVVCLAMLDAPAAVADILQACCPS